MKFLTIPFLFLSLCLSGNNSWAQDSLERAYAYQSAEKYDSAIYYFQKASEKHEATQHWEKYTEAVTGINRNYLKSDRINDVEKLGLEVLSLVDSEKVSDTSSYVSETHRQLARVNWYAKGDFPQALEHLTQALDICNKTTRDNTHQLLQIYTDFGYTYGYMGNYEHSTESFEKALNLALDRYGESHENIGSYYSNIAFPHYQKGEWQMAEKVMKDAIRLNIKNLGKDHMTVIKNYNNLGSLYLSKFDSEQANIYLFKALSLLRKKYGEDNRSVGIAYMNLGASYANKFDFEEALKYNKKAIDNLSRTIGSLNPYLSTIYRNSATCLARLGQQEEAQEYLNKTIALNKTLYGDVSPEMVRTYCVAAEIALENKDFKVAHTALIKARGIGEQILPQKHTNMAQVYYFLSEYYFHVDDYEKSLEFIQKALVSLIPSFNNLDIFTNPDPSDLIPNRILIDALTGKTKRFYKDYEQNITDETLEIAAENARFTDQAIDLLWVDYQMPHSKELLIKKVLPFYETAVEIALALYDKNGDEQYLEEAFKYVEKSKSILLMENLKANSSIKYANVPDSLVEKEINLKQGIKYYREQLIQARADNDSSRIEKFEDYFFTKKRDYDLLIEKLKSQHPEYYKIQHQITYLPMATIQGMLDPSNSLLEYYNVENYTYVFLISQNSIQYLKMNKIDPLDKEIRTFVQNLRKGNFDKSQSFNLYTQLVKPALDVLPESKTITIIPDGILNYLPFEVLLQSEQGQYLINDYSIHYLHSASLLKNDHRGNLGHNARFLGFAPKFNNKSNSLLATRSASDTILASQLEQLPMAQQEVEASALVWNGKYYIDNDATENNFKNMAPDFGLIHLATHAILDDENPLYSKLVFSTEKDSLNDGLLNTYELYNMNLNAQLACLSACNTGVGQLKSGEGVVSLARGFLYAGVPNVMMSLWSVPDNSTSEIMQYFYKALKSGEGKADALRTAKLEYLSHADENTSNPYYWAAFTLVGDNQPIEKETSSPLLFWIVGSLVIIMILAGVLFYQRRRRLPTHSTS